MNEIKCPIVDIADCHGCLDQLIMPILDLDPDNPNVAYCGIQHNIMALDHVDSCICASSSIYYACDEELKSKDAEIERLKQIVKKLEDDAKFEKMVEQTLSRDVAAILEQNDELKRKIAYCKKHGIWAEEDEDKN